MTATRKHPGFATPGASQNCRLKDDSKSHHTAPYGNAPYPISDPSNLATLQRLERKRAAHLEVIDRGETFDEQHARITAQAEHAVNDALERRRDELATAHALRENIRDRKTLRDRATGHEQRAADRNQCAYHEHRVLIADEYDNGRNEITLARVRCKQVTCKHCGPRWLAERLEQLADILDPEHLELHTTIAADGTHRSKLTRYLADQKRNKGTPYAALSVPLLDGRYLVLSTAPTPTSTPATYSEAIGATAAAFELLETEAATTGTNPTPGRNYRYVGDWAHTLTSLSLQKEEGTTCEPMRRVTLTSFYRPGVDDDIRHLLDEHGGRRHNPTDPDHVLEAKGVHDLDAFLATSRHYGFQTTDERTRRRHDWNAYQHWQDHHPRSNR